MCVSALKQKIIEQGGKLQQQKKRLDNFRMIFKVRAFV